MGHTGCAGSLAAGLASAAVSVKLELIIFGFNIMYIVSPLLAGFMESYVAGRKYGASTGALSAILVFFAVNIYGWLFPAEPIQWNVFTVGGLLMAFQAAFPTTVNFILAAAITYAWDSWVRVWGIVYQGEMVPWPWSMGPWGGDRYSCW